MIESEQRPLGGPKVKRHLREVRRAHPALTRFLAARCLRCVAPDAATKRTYSARTPRGRTGTSSFRISILNSPSSAAFPAAGATSEFRLIFSLPSVAVSLFASIVLVPLNELSL